MAIYLSIFLAIIGAWLIPWLAMKIVMALRFKSGKQQALNYAGKTVSYGLAWVWPVWALSLLSVLALGTWLSNALPDILFGEDAIPPVVGEFDQALLQLVQTYNFENTFFTLAVPLVLICFFFGWVDDRFGTKGDGGFKGHIRSLFNGQLTTGMAKVLGIGATSLIVALYSYGYGLFDGSFWGLGIRDVAWILFSTCAIALSANLINLFDLRPARASKVYVSLLLQVFAIAAGTVFVVAAVTGLLNPWEANAETFVYLLWALGPIFAIWRYDAGERAMLGDAGANPAGALMGLYAIAGLWILLPVYVMLVLSLNVLSERFSFTKLIEANPVLNWLDLWGRPKF
jgi:hypothetical protein